jgi:hypothetical protein
VEWSADMGEDCMSARKKIARWEAGQYYKLAKHSWNSDRCLRCCESRLFHKHHIGDVTSGNACPQFVDSGENCYPTLYPWRKGRTNLYDALRYVLAHDPNPPSPGEVEAQREWKRR